LFKNVACDGRVYVCGLEDCVEEHATKRKRSQRLKVTIHPIY